MSLSTLAHIALEDSQNSNSTPTKPASRKRKATNTPPLPSPSIPKTTPIQTITTTTTTTSTSTSPSAIPLSAISSSPTTLPPPLPTSSLPETNIFTAQLAQLLQQPGAQDVVKQLFFNLNQPATPAPPPAPTPEPATKRVRVEWDLDDEIALLRLVEKKGKGQWKLIYNTLTHIEHRLTDIPEDKAEEKLRTKYNDLKAKTKSKFFKEYEPPKFILSAKQRKAMKVEDIAKMEEDHVVAWKREEALIEEGKALIEKIENREERRGTSDVNNLTKVQEKMEQDGDTRKAQMREKVNAWEKNAQEEKDYRKATTDNMNALTLMLEENSREMKALTRDMAAYIRFKMGVHAPPTQDATTTQKD